jgi:3-oxoacyl-[acyl-carrier-protein] synthase-3
MSSAYVHDLGYALGEQVATVEESVGAGRTQSGTKVLRDAGFVQHHICGAETGPYELARRAVEDMGEVALEGTSAVIYATCLTLNGNLGQWSEFQRSRDVKHLMNFPVSHLQSEFKLDGAIAVGLNQQACTSLLGSLRIARGFLETEPDFERILCITADRFPPGAIYEQAYNLISDGSAGWMVSREPKGYRIVTNHQITNGAGVQADDDETVGMYFNYTHRLITETLAKASLTMDDVAWVVPQNMNRRAWQILARLLRLDLERVYFDPLPEVAHVISGDPVINLKRLEQSGRIAPGDRLLLIMAGYGLNWQSVILEKAGRA